MCWPHNDALVIRARVDNMEIRRIMIDTEISVNVMYKTCFDQMGLGAEQLSSSPDPLYGFKGNAIVPIGRVNLPLTIGDTDRHTTTITDFLIVD